MKRALLLGTSQGTQIHPCFCKSLIASCSGKEGWPWGGKSAGKIRFAHQSILSRISPAEMLFPRSSENESLERVAFC